MIDLASISGLHSHNYQLHAYCPRCDRWAVLPLVEMRLAVLNAARDIAVHPDYLPPQAFEPS